MTLLAGFAALLHRHSGQDDLCVGTPVAGRTRLETEPLIGFFVNTLVLRADLAGEPSFRQLLARVRRSALSAYAHQDLPFEKLVGELAPRRDLSRQPLVQVTFALQNAPMPELAAPGLTLAPLAVDTATAKFDLSLTVVPGARDLQAIFEYATDLFDDDRIERMAGHLRNLLEAAAADPDTPVSRLPMLGETERRQVLVEWSGGRMSTPPGPCLHDLFAVQAARRPDAVALTDGGDAFTYADLDRRSDAVARRLRALGAGPETLVGLCAERSPDLVIGMLGILRAGAAYVPLDPDYPRDRLAFMVEDSAAPIVLTQRGLHDRLPATGARLLDLDHLDAPARSAPAPASAPDRGLPDSAAYVMYTSGSTGRPKGVAVTHHQVVRLFDATRSLFGFDERDVWTLFHSFAFDFSVWELWGALAHGGRLVIVPYRVSRSPEAFHALLAAERVTVLNQTPSAFRELVRADQAAGVRARELALRTVIFGGEALELETLRPWFERHGDQRPRLVNMYGITETTVHVTHRALSAADLEAGRASVIGAPLPDLSLYLLDRHGQPVPIGVPGEICVGGAGVARGYFRRPALTAERFVPDRFGGGGRLYRSGDLARHRSDGELEYLGRADQQIKLRGFRIETGEIEAALLDHPAVRQCAVVVRDRSGEPGDRRLVAYVVATARRPTSAPTWPGACRAYMVPSAFVALERLPLTAQGKLDRAALPEPGRARVECGRGAAHRRRARAGPDLEPGAAHRARRPARQLLRARRPLAARPPGGGARPPRRHRHRRGRDDRVPDAGRPGRPPGRVACAAAGGALAAHRHPAGRRPPAALLRPSAGRLRALLPRPVGAARRRAAALRPRGGRPRRPGAAARAHRGHGGALPERSPRAPAGRALPAGRLVVRRACRPRDGAAAAPR